MGRWCLLLLMLTAAPSAYSACDVTPPAKEIFSYPELMKTHAVFQEYEIRVFDSVSCDDAVFKDRSGLEILKDGKRVYAETGYGYSVGYPLEQDQPPDSVKLKVGDDITGEGQPEMLVSEWTGGAPLLLQLRCLQTRGGFPEDPRRSRSSMRMNPPSCNGRA